MTKASASEVKQAHRLIDKLEESRPEVLEECEYLTADRGYDDGRLIEKLWNEHHIKPVIGIIRGLAKMKMSISITIATMLAMALGRVREKQGEHLRSLVKAA